MPKKKINIQESLESGWKIMVERFFFFLAALSIIFAFDLSIEYFFKIYKGYLALTLSVAFISYFIDILLVLGMVNIALKITRNKKTKIDDLFACHTLVVKQFFAEILYLLIVLGGLILFIVPGIIWAIKFQFFTYFIVDKGLDPIGSLKASAKTTKGVKGQLFWFDILIILINVVGLMFFGVGLFFTVPATIAATAIIYDSLKEEKKKKRKSSRKKKKTK